MPTTPSEHAHAPLQVEEGVFLKGFHTFKICAPSRGSSMTGRYPFNIGYYAMPPDDENQCTSNYTALPQLLKTMGYSTHAYGKWDVGYIAKACTPTYRGFDTFLGYYKAANDDLWYHGSGRCSNASAVDPTDMSRNTGSSLDSAIDINGTYSTRAFADAAIATIAAHNQTNGPLYLYIAPQNVHLAGGPSKSTEGIQAPCDTVRLYVNQSFIVFHRESAREHKLGTPALFPRSGSLLLLFMLTAALLMTSSHSEGTRGSLTTRSRCSLP